MTRHSAVAVLKDGVRLHDTLETYSFRAECFGDVAEASRAIAACGGDVHGKFVVHIVKLFDENSFPDCLVQFRSHFDFATLRRILGTVEDGHVMSETLHRGLHDFPARRFSVQP